MMKLSLLIPFMIAALDQGIKQYVRDLPSGRTFFRIDGLFELVQAFNTGAAFSFMRGNNAALICICVLLLFFLSVYIYKSMHLTKAAETACLFLIGGGIGNLIDRLLFGGVTDYIRVLFIDFPVFNLADIFITGSIFILILLTLSNHLETDTGESHGRNH